MAEVLLREVRDLDLPVFFEQQRDPLAYQMAAFPPREQAAFDAHWARIRLDPGILIRTILCDGQVAGNIVRFEQAGKPEVGYWVGRDFWGKGIATRALSAFLSLAQERPLYAHVARHNLASRSVLEKCGFRVIGEQHWSPNDGGEVVEEFVLRLDAVPSGG